MHLAGKKVLLGPPWLITTSLGEVGCYMGLAESRASGKTRKGNTKRAERTSFLSVFTPHPSLSHVTPRRFGAEAAWLIHRITRTGLECLFFQLTVIIDLLK